ncbi:hypothetical protein ACFY3N_35905 [Streptomyces sp. NPDC000348]|uniref:hypothetical protein n=1 Tax=Streptomyces sp. NPDC000348 TaxID=3364538 RepID=UPI00369874D7
MTTSTPERTPPRGGHPEPRLKDRFWKFFWPQRNETKASVEDCGEGERSDYNNLGTVVDAAYTATVDRLTEQRARLEDLRKRASALLAVAAALATFATSMGVEEHRNENRR